jgi:tetratricopeptide (TPR) repeat protein
LRFPSTTSRRALQAIGDPVGAAAAYERALALVTKALGDQHPNTLNLLLNLGGLYVDSGRANKGLRLLQRALRGRRQQAPINQDELANAVGAVGYAYLVLGRPVTALSYLEESSKMYEASGHTGSTS